MHRINKRLLALTVAGVFGLTMAFGLTGCEGGLPLPVQEETTGEEGAAGIAEPVTVAVAQGKESSVTEAAPEETTAPPEEDPPETTAAPEPESTSGIGSAYAELLSAWQDDYKQLLAGDSSAFESGSKFSYNYELSNRLGESGRDDRVQGSLADLNGDGTPELLISVFSVDEGKNVLFDVFAYDGEAVSLTPASLALELLGDGTVISRTGKGSSSYDFYRYDGGRTMTLFDGYSYEFGEGEERSWFHLNMETGSQEPVSEEDFQAAVDAHGEAGFSVFSVDEETLSLLRAGQLDELA